MGICTYQCHAPSPLPWVWMGFDKLRCQCPVYWGNVHCQIRTMFPPTNGSSTHLYGVLPQANKLSTIFKGCHLIHVHDYKSDTAYFLKCNGA